MKSRLYDPTGAALPRLEFRALAEQLSRPAVVRGATETILPFLWQPVAPGSPLDFIIWTASAPQLYVRDVEMRSSSDVSRNPSHYFTFQPFVYDKGKALRQAGDEVALSDRDISAFDPVSWEINRLMWTRELIVVRIGWTGFPATLAALTFTTVYDRGARDA